MEDGRDYHKGPPWNLPERELRVRARGLAAAALGDAQTTTASHGRLRAEEEGSAPPACRAPTSLSDLSIGRALTVWPVRWARAQADALRLEGCKERGQQAPRLPVPTRCPRGDRPPQHPTAPAQALPPRPGEPRPAHGVPGEPGLTTQCFGTRAFRAFSYTFNT